MKNHRARRVVPAGRQIATWDHRAPTGVVPAVFLAFLLIMVFGVPCTTWAASGIAQVQGTPAGESHHPEIRVPVGAPVPPQLTAASAALLDVSSGRLLYEKDAHVQRAPASLTKIVTALLALEEGNLDDVVEVSPRAAAVGGSSLWLEAGETETLHDLLYGLMLRSGNDAAEAIAEHIAGSADDFALLMNRRVEAIGASDTHFRNPHGLPASGHVTTAADMAIIARAALLTPGFVDIVSATHYVMPWPGQPWDRALYNENRLLWEYPGADGVKTGWTEEAGRCLVASAARDGWQLVAVFLDAPEMWADATELLDWGFEAFHPMEVCREGEELSEARVAGAARRYIRLKAGRDLRVAVLPGEEDLVSLDPEPPLYVTSPVDEGAEVGTLEVTLAGTPIGSVPLVAGEAVPEVGRVGRILQDLWVLLRMALQNLLGG